MKTKSARAGEVRQIKAELRDLKRNRAIISKTHLQWVREQSRSIEAIRREVNRGNRAVLRSFAKIDRRIAILEGRLS